MIRIRKKEKVKGNMQVEFICGKRAVEAAFKKFKFSSKLCKTLNCSEEEVLLRIDNLASECGNLSIENKNLKLQIADFEVQNLLASCDNLGGIRIVKNIFVNTDIKHVNLLASKLTSFEKVIVLYALKSEGFATLLFMCSKDLKTVSMNDLLKDAISLIDGKGGGSSFSAQGGGKGVSNLESAVNYAFEKAKKLINSI